MSTPTTTPPLSTANVLTRPVRASDSHGKKGLSPWQFWGLLLVVPYLLVFLVFVLYPVGYGLFLASEPDTYARLFDDPIFFRTLVNTVIFVVVAINLKMVVALFRIKRG